MACSKEKETNPTSVTLSETTATESTLATSPKEITFTIANYESNDVEIQWQRNSTNSPAGFTYMINGTAANAGSMEVKAGQTVTISLVVNANNNTGEATGTIVFYNEEDEAGTKKTFTYSIASFASYFTISPQGSMSGSGAVTGTTDYHINVVNPNNVPMNVVWEKIDGSANPSVWQTAVCTDAVCWTPNIVKEEMTIAANSTVDFKATFDAQNVVGTGEMTALFYIKSDSLASVTSQLITHTGVPK